MWDTPMQVMMPCLLYTSYGTTVYLYTDTYEGKHAEVPDVTGSDNWPPAPS